MTDLPDIRSGVYRHYKGPLYQVLGYSHNASDDNRPQVLYIGLELDRAKPGPRFATRDVEDFLTTVCRAHGGMAFYLTDGRKGYNPEHVDIRQAERTVTGHRTTYSCGEDDWVPRFTYLGPVYYAGMEQT